VRALGVCGVGACVWGECARSCSDTTAVFSGEESKKNLSTVAPDKKRAEHTNTIMCSHVGGKILP
jgi:hypothetical protein